jgi:hypothetical protein
MSRVAARLQTIGKPAPPRISLLKPPRGGLLQRKCACGASEMDGQCAECREKDLGLQRLAAGPGGPALAPPIVHDVLRSSGQPLDAATRAYMEPRFGHDFSRVRIHTDARAAASARAVGARAYTVGRHVVLAEGNRPAIDPAPDELLAHELTHVVQQQNESGGDFEPLSVAPTHSELEREADHCARSRLADRASTVVPTSAPLSLQRQDDGTIDVDLQDVTPEENQQLVGQGVNLPVAQTGQPPPVFFCSKSVALGFSHAFFRVGGAGPGNPTYELEHDDLGEHCPCGFQGWPTRDYPEDRDAADSPCTPLPGVTQACLDANYLGYPVGRYCATGPNSNTYARWLAEKCGAVGIKPPGNLPGFGDSPPAPGTAAPPAFPGTGVLGTVGLCGSINCDNDSCLISD